MSSFIRRFAHRWSWHLVAADPGAPLGGLDPVASDALGISAPMLSLIGPALATLSPEQAQELGYGLGRR